MDVSACMHCCIVCQKEKPIAPPREEIFWTDKGDFSLAGRSFDPAGPFPLDTDGNRYLLVAIGPFLK